MRRLLLASAVAASLWAALSASPDPAFAHATQASSEPAPGAQLREPPERITIVFTEPVEPSVTTVQLWNQDAQQVALDPPAYPRPDTLEARVPVELPPGHYTVVWRNLSTVDAHTWQGSFVFTVLLPGGGVPGGMAAVISGGGASSDRPSALDSAARWIVLLAGAALTGGTLFALFVARPAAGLLSSGDAERMWKTTRVVTLAVASLALALAFEGALLQLLVQANRLGDLERVDDLLLETRFGKYLLARQGIAAGGLLLLSIAWRTSGRRATALFMGGLLVTGVALSLTNSLVSHAAARDGAVWSTAIDFLHSLGGAVWIGSLLVTGFTFPRWLDALRAGPRTVLAAEAFRRFSILATVSVALLLASGVLSAFIQVEALGDLWSTNWGRALSAKMGLAALLLVAGAYNAYVLGPQVVHVAVRFDSPGRVTRTPGIGASDALRSLHRRLATTVRVEAALGVAVLAAVAVLTQLQSPASAAVSGTESATASRRAGELSQAVEVGSIQLFMSVDPGTPGENTFNVGVGSEFSTVPEVAAARLRFRRGAEDAGTLDLSKTTQSTTQASFVGFGSTLSRPGDWTIEAEVDFADGTELRQAFDVSIGDPAGNGHSIWRWPLKGWLANGVFGVSLATVGLIAVWQLSAPTVRRRSG
ncbi:MAG: copper resistance protein CopC/CopD [Dehalococcoidia bacterium]|nr:copper resistance protein CopC/CopD [Dehalococcoidia bacterium]